MTKLKKIAKYSSFLLALFVIWMFINGIRIHSYSSEYSEKKSDVAIILGAGTSKGKVSPVFRERINHGINLFRKGRVKALIFTGGYGKNQNLSDSRTAMLYAIANGVPEENIHIEEKSTITFTNLTHSKIIMNSSNYKTVLLVSDPYHMKRSVAMCEKLEIEVESSPTPTTMYKSFQPKIKSLIYESFFYNLGIIQGYI